MADNVNITPGAGATVAADDVGGALYQRVKVVHGADGSATDTSAAAPLPVYERDDATATAFGPISTANAVLFTALEMSDHKSIALQITGLWNGAIYLQQSNDATTWFDVQGISQSNSGVLTSTIYAPDLVTIHVVARYFRAVTSGDFTGSVSGSYAARCIQPPTLQQDVRIIDVADDLRLHMFGRTLDGYSMGLRTSPLGGLMLADNQTITGSLSRLGSVVLLETTGYNSVSVQLIAGLTGTVTFQVSNDATTWNSVLAWPVAGGTAPVTSTTAAGHWIVPAIGRFFRAQITAYTSGAAVVIAALKNQNAFLPQSTPSVTIAANSSVNVAQVGAATLVAESTAATTIPVIVGGIVRTALPPSDVIAGDAIRETFSLSGQLITKQNAPGDLDFFVNATVTTNAQTQLRAAQGAGIRMNVTSVTYQSTTAVATTLTIQDASATLVTFSVPASMTEARQLIFPTPLRGTANAVLNYLAGTNGANVLLNVTGFNSY